MESIEGRLVQKLKLWWHPPTNETALGSNIKPNPTDYHLRRLFLWMPRLMCQVDLKCKGICNRSLCSKGIYNNVRLVIDTKTYYYLAGE